MPVKAGELNRRVIFKAPVNVSADGETDITYPAVTFITFAKVRAFDQIRAVEANATAFIDTKEFTIRYSEEREAINKDWLLVYNGVDYVLHSNPTSEDKTEIKMLARAKTNG